MGVILATGFVHMFPPADQSLNSPCLGEYWHRYSSLSGVFALVAALSTQLIQTAAINHFARLETEPVSPPELHAVHNHHDHHSHHDTAPVSASASKGDLQESDSCHHQHTPTAQQEAHDCDRGRSLFPTSHQHLQPSVGRRASLSQTPSNVELGALAVATNIHSDGCCAVDHAILSHGGHQHRKITAYILEVGVALHSILIGVTLGVSRGSEFNSLLIAIAFHQFFEGFALASTAMDAGFESWSAPVLMSAVYTFTTPIGVAVGISLMQFYRANSPEALIVQGVFDGVCAGILIYDALVNLITVNITHSRYFSGLSTLKKGLVLTSLWLGAGVMSLIGIWL